MEKEVKQLGFICCLCDERTKGWGENLQFGNNPAPLKYEGECCNICNDTKVIPERLKRVSKGMTVY